MSSGVQFLQADAAHLPLADRSVDLVFGSPPYCDARTYDDGTAPAGFMMSRRCADWVRWMTHVTLEALRVSKGPVLWVAAGTQNYNPAVEGLIYEMWRLGCCQVLRPAIWTKNAPPTGKGWFSNDWEFVAAFTHTWPLPHWDPEAIATPVKYTSGGHFRQRGRSGERKRGSDYPQHKLRKRPSNVIHVTVGGGHLGHPLAHQNEAPFPEKLVEPFLLALCPAGGTVLDPFSGSGTTGAVALAHGRRAILNDIRGSQRAIAQQRLADTAPLIATQREA